MRAKAPAWLSVQAATAIRSGVQIWTMPSRGARYGNLQSLRIQRWFVHMATKEIEEAKDLAEALRECEAGIEWTEKRILGHPDVINSQSRVIRRHVESPHVLLDYQAVAGYRNQKARNSFGVSICA